KKPCWYRDPAGHPFGDKQNISSPYYVIYFKKQLNEFETYDPGPIEAVGGWRNALRQLLNWLTPNPR
ncbi:MAG: hypothetical protein VX181_02085, partial [Pseudomonadota bacterium]|nr:hypothetical protein [Pseudomonadota bacterium]